MRHAKMVSLNNLGKRPLRVCHLAKFYPPATGGIESHLRTLAKAQVRLGLSVRVVCVNHLDDGGNDVTWNSFVGTSTVKEMDGDVELLRVGRRASFFRFELCPRLVTLSSLLHKWHADVVHLHVPNPMMLLALLPSLKTRPTVISYHSDIVRQKKLNLIMRPFEIQVFRHASAVLTASPPYAESSPWLRRYAEKVKVVPYGIDLPDFTLPSPAAIAESIRLREKYAGQPLWLSVCRLVYYKGLLTALEALREVPGHLLIIGEGPLAMELKQQSEQLGVADRVTFQGRASDEEIIGACHAATALWFPSNARSEAFGISQLEAMASGCPVINTAILGSGAAWVSRDGESGLTVPVGDPKALAAAARRLINDPALRECLSAGARTRAINEFGSTKMAEHTLEEYQKALGVCPK